MNTFGKQRTLAMMTGFERYTKKTRRAMFLEEMEQVVPWENIVCADRAALSPAGQRTTAEKAGTATVHPGRTNQTWMP